METNKNNKVLVLGASGMLGAMVLDVLSRDENITADATVRDEDTREHFQKRLPEARWHVLNAESADEETLKTLFDGYNWIINCIGITKPYIRDENSAEVTHAVKINILFSHAVGNAALAVGAEVLQIATDCVYDGQKGAYRESEPHNAVDAYGRTKSLGEAVMPNVHHLRCSIIGPEPRKDIFLLAWLIKQPENATLNGFVNHEWNGVTTLHFALICQGIIGNRQELSHSQHIIPGDTINKCELLKTFAREYGREDITINPVEAGTVVDRTLDTRNETMNRVIWKSAGYHQPPGIKQMVKELRQYDFHFRVK
jgi:dTDP-4-dehydrorhamnose reductase